jgi:glycosyltransferase involved in cell wall biosynthesis
MNDRANDACAAEPAICVTVLAHDEERRIATCLNSLPLDDANVAVHVVVNGSTDATADIASAIAEQHTNVKVHIFSEGGKARSWNRFVFEELSRFHNAHIFVDGDAEILPGSVAALASTLVNEPTANAASALPMNGRKAEHYQHQMRREHGLFGDLYALQGSFLARMKEEGIRLPDDVIGDDGLICAMAKTDLCDETHWQDPRVAICESAGFLCAPVSLLSPLSWRMQYRRMINYSVRHFQNRMISQIMRQQGPKGLPRLLSTLYASQLPSMRPRSNPQLALFDRIALKRMERAAKQG